MTNETKHTPTPWDKEVIEDIWIKGVGKVFAEGKIGIDAVIAIVSGTTKADAAHIVKCVNMHDELVKAIRGLLDVYSRPDVTWCCNGHHCGCRGYSSRDIAEYFADETLKKAGAL